MCIRDRAYVDALETIRDRYSDVKIMAITHDDAMKARFGQAVTCLLYTSRQQASCLFLDTNEHKLSRLFPAIHGRAGPKSL